MYKETASLACVNFLCCSVRSFSLSLALSGGNCVKSFQLNVSGRGQKTRLN